ncbi:hypothetical protein [Neisseria sp.]|uniref:hypothetical protein n=1 Tax=Neisseria sp. TaxID=192066 RepID=UPI00359FC807
MKKILTAVLAAFTLGACAADSGFGGLGTTSSQGGFSAGSIVKMAVENQCRNELGKRKEWRLIALAMSAEKQEEWERKICGCAAEEAPNQLSAADLSQIFSESGRMRIATEVTAKTVTACVKRLYR